MNEKAGEARNTRGIVSLLIDMQSRLERSYLRMDDIQFGRHAHVLGVGTFKAWNTTNRSIVVVVFSN
jgi:hypothetical protein